MASLTHTYTDTHTNNRATALARTGGPRRYSRPANAYERNERSSNERSGSHMPLDLDIHWQWSNPLNIIPALTLLLVIIAAVALIVG